MELAQTGQLRINWQDRKGREAQCGLRFPSSTPVAVITAQLIAFATRMQALTGATPTGAYWRIVSLPEAYTLPVDADISRVAILYYRNGEEVESFVIPAIRDSLLETEGDYAGIRINYADDDVKTVIDELTEVLALALQPDGESWTPVYIVGGLML